jgi:hypothetical protein
MKVTRLENSREKRILTAMILKRSVLGPISVQWQKDMFLSEWANIVGQWCISFYRKYHRPPGKSIQSLATDWAEKQANQDKVALVEKFLATLSDEATPINSEYILDQAREHFNEVRKTKFASQVSSAVEIGQWDKVDEIVRELRPVHLGKGADIDLLQDEEAWRGAMEQQMDKSIVPYSGALKDFMGDSLSRGSFVSFMGPPGRGKSWLLLDVACRALRARNRVAFFCIGDMTQAQIVRRFMVRLCRNPRRPGMVKVPNHFSVNGKGHDVRWKEEEFQSGVTFEMAKKKFPLFQKEKLRSKRSFFKLQCHPTKSLTVERLRQIIEDWAREDWLADCVILDYSDLLKHTSKDRDSWNQINELWEQLRAIPQAYNNLLVTATQSARGGYSASLMKMEHVGGAALKNAHVSAMIGINHTDEEKALGIFRLNMLKLREDEFVTTRTVYLASCLALGNPAVLSCWRTKKGEDDD